MNHSQKLEEFAKRIGVDSHTQKNLMWIVEEALSAPLPEGWTEHTSSKGYTFFYHNVTDESTKKHPLEDYYRELAKKHMQDGRREEQRNGIQAEIESSAFLGVTPEEVIEMADYFGIDVKSEFQLLQFARQAVVAPLPSHWMECGDRSGSVYYYNSRTDHSTREHPVDKHFKRMIEEARKDSNLDSPTGAWMVFLGADASPLYFNFLTGVLTGERPLDLPPNAEELQRKIDREFMRLQLETPTAEEDEEEIKRIEMAQMAADERASKRVPESVDEDPNSPRTVAIRKFLDDVGEKAENEIKGWIESGEYTTAGLALDGPRKIAKPPPPPKKAAPNPKVLVFYSWWFEERQRRYLELQYHLKTGFFKIVLDKSIVLKDVKIAGRSGEMLSEWDLYIGQRIDVLGKPTTLMQGSLATVEWLEYHANKLLKKALKLELECMKFTPMNQTIHKMVHSERPAKKGSRNLRWLMRQIDALNAILESFKHPDQQDHGGDLGSLNADAKSQELQNNLMDGV